MNNPPQTQRASAGSLSILATLFFVCGGWLVSIPTLAQAENIAIPRISQQPTPEARDAQADFGIETIDPYTGRLRIVSRDLVVRGNGGLDIEITRVYTSLPYSGDLYPNYLAGRTTTGIGWDIHFGRVWIGMSAARHGAISGRHSTATGCRANNIDSKDNPVLELPDGTREVLVNDTSVIFRRNGATGFSAYRSQAAFGIKEPLPG